MRLCTVLFAVALSWIVLATAPAHALCTPTASDLTFAGYDPVTGSAVDASSTISIACTGMLANTQYSFCVSMESGNGFTGNQRQLVSGSDRMSYGLYSDAARTTDWGSYRTGFGVTGAGYQTTLTTGASTNFNFTLTYYGRIAAGQNTLPPSASYLSTFNTSGLFTSYRPSIRWAPAVPILSCPLMVLEVVGTTTFTVSSSITKNCSVSAALLNFGSTLNLSANVDATSTINVGCTNTTPYTIGLDAGTGSGATLTNRKMTLSGNTINYSMFTDAGRVTNWGTATASGTGSGATQPFTVYGRVFGGQPLPNPGTYTDTITATVTF